MCCKSLTVRIQDIPKPLLNSNLSSLYELSTLEVGYSKFAKPGSLLSALNHASETTPEVGTLQIPSQNPAHCLFLYNLQAKRGFYTFKGWKKKTKRKILFPGM